MQRAEAETLALGALSWAAADGQALSSFLETSGLTLDDLRDRAGTPQLLAALVDFLLAHEKLAEAFCAFEGLDGETLKAIRRALPGSTLE